jgi:glycosyltransferase involved in cell wall biosynthesis
VIPLGVDASAFPARRRRRSEKLRFLHDATKGGDYRKGQQLAIDAFQAAFPGRRDVELVIRCTIELNASSLELRDDSRVSLKIAKMPTDQLNRLYGEFDAMLYPSRSEGFGLIPLQAMATGMPCIFPRSSGMLAYANYGLTVEAHPVTAWVGRGCPDAPPWTFQQPNEWYEPDFDQLVDRLRQIDTEYDALQERAMLEADQVATEWSWDRSARAILARLEA